MPLALILVGILFWATAGAIAMVARAFVKAVQFTERHGTHHGARPV